MFPCEYILALRFPLKKPECFLKRNNYEVGINNYNRDILHIFGSNMDIQIVIDEYAAASYMLNYVVKSDIGLTKLLQNIAQEKHHESVRKKLVKLSNAFLNTSSMSSQEAVYHLLPISLSRMSRACTFINTSPINERNRALKQNKALEDIDEESCDIFRKNIFEKYSERPALFESECLADFASKYKLKSMQNLNDDIENPEDISKLLKSKVCILRYRKYKIQQDENNFYREHLLLFLPWRNEYNEIENINCKEKYDSNINIINKNRKKYSKLNEDLLLEAMNQIEEQLSESSDDEEHFHMKDNKEIDKSVDINIQAGDKTEIDNPVSFNKFITPVRIPNETVLNLMEKLNTLQRRIVLYVMNNIRNNDTIRLFISGSAGVGKSMVIKTIYHLITNYYDSVPGKNKDDIVVLLCAPTGKAAFFINGMTLHATFHLPISQVADKMTHLSADNSTEIRSQLLNAKLLIIDEISMVGAYTFNNRLQEIMKVEATFGGLSVICVGDLNQLPPVCEPAIFKPPCKFQGLALLLINNPIWEEFKYFELNEVMRQKNDIPLISALNNLASNCLTDNDYELFCSREIQSAS